MVNWVFTTVNVSDVFVADWHKFGQSNNAKSPYQKMENYVIIFGAWGIVYQLLVFSYYRIDTV